MKKVIVYIAMSLDGYIAGKNDDLGFLSLVEEYGEDYGYSDFIKQIDTVVMGRKTYDKVLSFGIPFPHTNKKTFIITRTARPKAGKVTFYTGNLKDLVLQLKSEGGKHIYVDGGAETIQALLKEELIDEFILSIVPVLLGDGTALFRSESPAVQLKLMKVLTFKSGLVQLHYARTDRNAMLPNP